jgi:hypothetical protein
MFKEVEHGAGREERVKGGVGSSRSSNVLLLGCFVLQRNHWTQWMFERRLSYIVMDGYCGPQRSPPLQGAGFLQPEGPSTYPWEALS